MKLIIYLFAAIITLSATSLSAQRCGGHLKFTVLDQTKKISDSLKYKKLFLEHTYSYQRFEKDVSGPKVHYSSSPDLKMYRIENKSENISQIYYEIKTGCGMRAWSFEIELDNKLMAITIKNILMEAEYFLFDFPFIEGNFVVDLNSVNDNIIGGDQFVEVKKYLVRE